MQSVNLSNIGLKRKVNEDRVLSINCKNGYYLYAVADGMGGHNAGDEASEMAVRSLELSLQEEDMYLVEQENRLGDVLRAAFLKANEEIWKLSNAESRLEGMGTTLVAALLNHEQYTIASIGDSRAYLYAHQELQQLTEDHTLVHELIKSGELTPEQAREHPRRNIILRALGTAPEIQVDLYQGNWQSNDLLIICSDGLCGGVEDQAIQEIIKNQNSDHLQTISDRLLEAALDSGGDDNISFVLIKCTNDDNSSEHIINDEKAKPLDEYLVSDISRREPS